MRCSIQRPDRRPLWCTRPALERLEARETPAIADIAVTVTDGMAAIPAGAGTAYTIRVVNNGPEAVTGVTINNAFPSAPSNTVSWTAQTFGGAAVSQTAGTGSFALSADLPAGAQVIFSATLVPFPNAQGTLVDFASAALAPGDSDPNPANNSAVDATEIGPVRIPDAVGGTLYATGSGPGAPAHVNAYVTGTGQLLWSFLPFGSGFTGGVEVSTGDVTGDGWDDIVVGAGPGGPPHVKVFDGRTGQEVASFLAFDPGFRGGVHVAAARFDPSPLGTQAPHNEGQVVVGAGPGAAPHVRVFRTVFGQTFQDTPLGSFLAYDATFTGGVRVAAGDIDGVRGDELVTAPGPGSAQPVQVFNSSGTKVASFLAFAPGFRGGMFVAVGNVDGIGGGEILIGAEGSSHVKVFDGTGTVERASFLAFDPGFRGGARVAAGDRNGDGRADIIVAAGPGASPHVEVLAGLTLDVLDSFFAYDPAFIGGAFVG
ncbi:MAG TPA: hypothetical protein VGE74_25535 [Gemmata sp.]